MQIYIKNCQKSLPSGQICSEASHTHHAKLRVEAVETRPLLVLYRLGEVVHAVVDDVRILERLVGWTIYDGLAVVVVDGRANEFCFLQRDQRQLAQHLARQLRALVGVVVVPPFS